MTIPSAEQIKRYILYADRREGSQTSEALVTLWVVYPLVVLASLVLLFIYDEPILAWLGWSMAGAVAALLGLHLAVIVGIVAVVRLVDRRASRAFAAMRYTRRAPMPGQLCRTIGQPVSVRGWTSSEAFKNGLAGSSRPIIYLVTDVDPGGHVALQVIRSPRQADLGRMIDAYPASDLAPIEQSRPDAIGHRPAPHGGTVWGFFWAGLWELWNALVFLYPLYFVATALIAAYPFLWALSVNIALAMLVAGLFLTAQAAWWIYFEHVKRKTDSDGAEDRKRR